MDFMEQVPPKGEAVFSVALVIWGDALYPETITKQ